MDCCAKSRVPGFGAHLIPVSEEIDIWNVKLQLFRCSACSSLWTVRQNCVGHQDWTREVQKVSSEEAFAELVQAQEREKRQRWAELRAVYEREGKEWKWS